MRGLSQEFVFALIFGAVLLVQFLYKQLRTKAAAMREEAESGPDFQTTPLPLSADPTRAQADGADALRPVEASPAAPTSVAARASPLTRPRPRRFSRADLMPDRRALKDAIVIAAILRPCHAHRPHDVD